VIRRWWRAQEAKLARVLEEALADVEPIEHTVRPMWEHVMVDEGVAIYCCECGGLSAPYPPRESVLSAARMVHRNKECVTS